MVTKKLLTVKLTPAEMKQLKKDAYRLTGGNVSELIRRAVAAYVKGAKK